MYIKFIQKPSFFLGMEFRGWGIFHEWPAAAPQAATLGSYSTEVFNATFLHFRILHIRSSWGKLNPNFKQTFHHKWNLKGQSHEIFDLCFFINLCLYGHWMVVQMDFDSLANLWRYSNRKIKKKLIPWCGIQTRNILFKKVRYLLNSLFL